MARAGLAAAVVIGLALGGCGLRGGENAPPEPGDTAVARVAGETIWASDVNREAVAQGVIGEGEPLDASSEQFAPLVEQVIDQRLLAREAERRGLDDDPAVRRKLEAARRQVLGDALVEREVDGAVDAREVRRLYDEFRRGEQASETVRIRRIVVAAEADARSIRQALEGGASFDALAAERSTDAATRFSGGDLGYVDPAILPAPYVEALRGAAIGSLIGPVQAENAWAVLRVDDRRREPVRSLEEMRPQIVRFLSFDRVRELLQKLRADTEVDVLIERPDGAPRPQEPASAPVGAAAAKEGQRP